MTTMHTTSYRPVSLTIQPQHYSYIMVFTLILLITSPFAAAAGNEMNKTPNSMELFLPVANKQASPARASQAGWQAILFNRALAHLKPGTEVYFSSPRGTRYTVVFDQRTQHASGNTTWTGSLKDQGDDYRAMITFGEDGLSGRILTPEGLFMVKSNATGEWLIDAQAAGLSPVGFGANDGIAPPVQQKQSRHLKQSAAAQAPITTTNTTSSTIDVLVLYTPDLASRLGNGLSTRIDQLIALSNQAYLDSGIHVNLRLAHKQQINYNGTESNSTLLKALTNGTGVFSSVADLRNTHGADLVALLRPFRAATTGSSCGTAWVIGSGGQPLLSQYAYAVVNDGDDVDGSAYYCSDLSLTHELGHLMGSAHDRANADISGVYPYSYGYGIAGTFGTVMSYIDPEIGKFSNPAITCKGIPCGISETANNAANNVLSINNTRSAIADFRSSVAPPTPLTGRLVNLSTRGWVGTGGSVMIAGFIIGGNAPKQVLIRAIGPALANAGVSSVLNDPMMTLTTVHGRFITENNNWQETQADAIRATGKAPSNNRESAILTTLEPGPYTAIVRGVNDTVGNALVEVYEINAPTVPLANISTRGWVGTGYSVMIAGFIIGGNGPQQVLIRAIGPALAQANVPSVLNDPSITLTTVQGAFIAENDNWQQTQEAAIRATRKAPEYPSESAILITLDPGPYTAIVSGVGNTEGNALVEVFQQADTSNSQAK